jgi:hypothetical protein
MDAEQLRDLGQQLRVDAVRAAAAAGSKPVDAQALRGAAEATGAFVTAEDHRVPRGVTAGGTRTDG